jgi:hypothetical protein
MVQDGARYAVVDVYGTASSDQIADETSIRNVVLYGDKDGGTTPLLDGVTVSIDHANKYVTVTATYPYTPVLSIIPKTMVANLNIALTASAVMRTAL